MKKINLTNGKSSIIDDDDYDHLSKYKWLMTKNNYAVRYEYRNGETFQFLMHRQIMGYPIDMEIDHINGDKLDNRKLNLRICSRAENDRNSRPHRDGSSKFKGVSRIGKRSKGKPWRARIWGGKEIVIGYFLTEEEAAIAYNVKAKELFGEFAYLNKVT